MALTGKGAVAIWHDIAPEGRAAFYAWHDREHMPERVGIPGFLRGRRYVAFDGAPEFFNLYETATTAVLTGTDYLARLNAPTPLTVATVQHFRGVARSLCAVAASAGSGDGGLCATFRYDVASARAPSHRPAMAAALREFAATPEIAAAHLLVADEAASAIETEEKRVRTSERNQIPRWIVLVEASGDTGSFARACAAFVDAGAFADAIERPRPAIYRLQLDLRAAR